MKNSVAINKRYWHSNHGVMVMKKYVADKIIAPTQNCSKESRYNQGRNDSVGPKLKV